MRSWIRFVRRTPSLTLLVAQLLGVVVYPFFSADEFGRTLFAAFGILVLTLTMRALRATPFFSWFSGLVFVPAVLLLVAAALIPALTTR